MVVESAEKKVIKQHQVAEKAESLMKKIKLKKEHRRKEIQKKKLQKAVKQKKSAKKWDKADNSAVSGKFGDKAKSQKHGDISGEPTKKIAKEATFGEKKKRKRSDVGEDDENSKKMKIDKSNLHQLKKKQRRAVYKQMDNSNYELVQKSKKIWEELRQHDLTAEKRAKLCQELYDLIKGKAEKLIFAHDTVRVFECLEQYGVKDYRTAIFNELQGKLLEMTKSKYAKFFVKKVIKYGTKDQRTAILSSWKGQVTKLVKHAHAADVVEYFYNEFANAIQRQLLVGEFYGRDFALFQTETSQQSLDEILKCEPAKKETLLNHLKGHLLQLTNKDILQHSLVHRLFLEFLQHANTEKLRSEVIEVLRDCAIHMMHTHDGSRVARHCVWHGTAKDRKLLIKSLKSHVHRICTDEYAHLVLLSLFDSVDDTKLIEKVIISEMIKSLKDIALHPVGRKVVLYLLSRRDPLFFHPDVVRNLSEGDSIKTSKKDPHIRERELREAISRPALSLIEEHTKEMVLNKSACLLSLAILQHAIGDQSKALTAIATLCAEQFVSSGSVESHHIVEHVAGHLLLKKLLQADKMRKQNNQISFAELLLEYLPEGALKSWLTCNRGAFIVVALLETENAKVVDEVKQHLKGCKKLLARQETKGAKILLEKLR